MSWQACDAIDRLPYDVCGPLAFRVLQKLANVAAQDGSRAWRTVGTMAGELGVSKRSIQRATKELESARLIIRGDQRFVQHLRADRRPTVYDINMHYAPEWQQPEIDGVTQLSTATDGVTSGVTTAVVQEAELRERVNNTSQRNQTGDVTPCPDAGDRRHKVITADGICVLCGARTLDAEEASA